MISWWDRVGTMISKFAEKLWDIDIKKITVSHCHHIACILSSNSLMRADRQSLQAVQGDSGGRGRARAEAIHPHPLLLPALQGDREEEGLCWKHPCSISKNLQIRDKQFDRESLHRS